jgi:hypothetical protein
MKNATEDDEIVQELASLLPAWFCPHMLARDGKYAFMMEGGNVVVAVKRINMIHQDNASRIWLDVEMMNYADAEIYLDNGCLPQVHLIAATGEQHKASISAATVMVAYEMGDRLTHEIGSN